MTNFEKNLRSAFLESQNELCLENQKSDDDYQELRKEWHELFGKICGIIGEDNKDLMYEFEEVRNAMGGINDEYIYLKGMIDCVELLKIIRLI